jgi:hypothetical protein
MEVRASGIHAGRRAGMIVALGCLFAAAPGAAEPTLPPEAEAVRAALEKYRDPVAAVHDGYFSTLGCVHYAEGGMGIHFLNTGLIGPVPDPMTPPILIYEPDDDGVLHLVAAEWFVPLATGVAERPELFGQPFDGPMAGHAPLMPEELHHYDLHVWLFKENPNGLFNVVNPDVTCEGKGPYALLEEPPPQVQHHQ